MNAFYILHMTFYLLFMKCLQSSDVFTFLPSWKKMSI